MTNEDFEKIVRETLQSLPHEFKSQLDNVEIVIEDEPRGQDFFGKISNPHTLLLGLYRGVPKTKRYSYFALPDKITIFKNPILHISRDESDAQRIIRDTVLHEIGHHFGLSDAELSRIK